VISSINSQTDEITTWLENLGKLWCSGITPNWQMLMEPLAPYRIPLPQYPFERARHWIESSAVPVRARLGQPDVKLPFEEWFYLPDWQQTLLPASNSPISKTWLVFANDSALSKEFLKRFAQDGATVTVVRPGEKFEKINDHEWVIRPGEARDYIALLSAQHALTFDTILHLWSMPQADTQALNIGQSLIHIALGLDSLRQPHTRIVVLSPPFHYVNGTETIDPLRATLIGPLLVIPQEMPHISMHCIDIELPALNQHLQQRVMDLCWRELQADHYSSRVALRQDRRYVLGFKHIDMPQAAPGAPSALRHQGVYLITGGLGRMGLVLAEYLTKQVQARLILLSRTPLPAREQWLTLTADINNHTDSVRTIRTLLHLEELGADILVIPADVSDAQSMAQAFQASEARFGEIHGVIHAAGAPSAIQTIADMAAGPLSVNVESKISGTNILFELLGERKADFCILMSSSAALLGGLAFTSYTASNAYLDAFAEYANRTSDTHWLSINWDAWEYENSGTIPPQEAAFWMKAAEATEAFNRILHTMPSGRIAVASADLQARYIKWSSLASSSNLDIPLVQHERPNLTTIFSAPESATERALSEIWCSLLGYAEIGRMDDFFELGGDSMLGIRMIGAVSQRLGHLLPLTIFLERPNIQSMAQAIDQDLSALKFTPLVSMQTIGELPPFYCVPGTGGSVLYLTDLARGFGKLGRPFYGLQAKGLDGHAKPLDNIEDIAALNIATIQTVQPHGPYYLGGHSFGCWVALEMARQLVQAGEQVARLIILDAGTPSGRDLSEMSGWDDSKWLITVADTISHMYDKPLFLPMERIANLSWNDQISALAEQLVNQKIIDSHDNVELVRGIVEVFKTQAQIIYDPPSEPRIPISMFRAKIILEGFLDGMPEHLKTDEAWGWNQYAHGSVTLNFVDGDHLTMVSRLHATELSEIIHQQLLSKDE
jgi:thioesterase domain-containing protein/NAD(P)-dependent dehydrogenase (short-subunit alcohol dehydrogenase family)